MTNLHKGQTADEGQRPTAITEHGGKYGSTINLTPDAARYPFRLGEKKARAVLDQLDDLRAFVNQCDDINERRADHAAEVRCGIA